MAVCLSPRRKARGGRSFSFQIKNPQRCGLVPPGIPQGAEAAVVLRAILLSSRPLSGVRGHPEHGIRLLLICFAALVEKPQRLLDLCQGRYITQHSELEFPV